MAELLTNEFTVNRPVDQAWPIITDIERIAPCLPGAELQEVEGDKFRGVVKVKLGAISTQFKGEAHFIERDDAAHRAVISATGRDTGGRGNAKAEITAQAESLSPTSSRVVVTTDLHITGKIAQFGRGIMGDVSAKLMEQFAANLNEMLDADNLEVANADDAGTETASDAGGDDAPSESTDVTASAPATGTPSTDSVRKIDGPAADPIDLMVVGGSSVFKRIAPALLAVALAFLIIRRVRRS